MADDIVIGIGADLGPLEEQANKAKEELLKIGDNAEKAAEIIDRNFGGTNVSSIEKLTAQVDKLNSGLKLTVEQVAKIALQNALKVPESERAFGGKDPNKVFISDVVPAGIAIEAFKAALLQAAQQGFIALSRIDLVQALSKAQFAKNQASQIELLPGSSTAVANTVNISESLGLSPEAKAAKEEERIRRKALLVEEEAAFLKNKAARLAAIEAEKAANNERFAKEQAITAERQKQKELTLGTTISSILPPSPPSGGGGPPSGGAFNTEGIAASRQEMVALAVATANVDKEIERLTSDITKTGKEKLPIATEEEIDKITIAIRNRNNEELQGFTEPRFARIIALIGAQEKAFQNFGEAVRKAGEEEVKNAQVAITINEKKLEQETKKQDAIEKAIEKQKRLGEAEEKQRVRSDILTRADIERQQRQGAAPGITAGFGAGFNVPTEAGIAGVTRFQNALLGLQTAITRSTAPLSQIQDLLNRIKADPLTVSVQQLDPALQKVGATGLNVVRIIQSLQTQFQQTGQAGILAGTGIDTAFQRVESAFIRSVVFRVTGLISQGFREGVATAIQFQEKIAQLQTTTSGSNLSFDQLSNTVRKLSEEFGRPVTDVAAAAYTALSSNVAQGANSFEFLRNASELARVTLSTTEDAARATADAINAFGLSAREQARVSDVLFKTVQDGGIQFKELEGTIGRAGFTAHAIGLSLEETTAAIATLARDGVKASEAMTFLNNILNQLIRPTETTKEFLKELGFNTGEEAIAVLGLTGVLGALSERTQNNAALLAQFGGELRASKALFDLARDGATKYNDELLRQRGAAGSVKEANKIFEELPAEKFKQQTEAIKNFFSIEIGQSVLKSIVTFSENIVSLKAGIETLALGVGVGVTAFTAYKLALLGVNINAAVGQINLGNFRGSLLSTTVATNAATGATITLRSALLGLATATGIGALFAAIGFGISKIIEAFDQASEKAKQFTEQQKKLAAEATILSREATESRINDAKFENDTKLKRFFEFQRGYKQLLDEQVEKTKAARELIEGSFKIKLEDFLAPIRDSLHEASRTASQLKADIDAGAKSVADLQRQSIKISFGTAVGFEQIPERRAALLQQEFQTLGREQAELFKKGDKESIESARRITQERLALAKQIGQNLAEINKQDLAAGRITTQTYIDRLGNVHQLLDQSGAVRREFELQNKAIADQKRLEAENAEARKKQIEEAKAAALDAKVKILEINLAEKALIKLLEEGVDKNGDFAASFKKATPQESLNALAKETEKTLELLRKAVGDDVFGQLVKSPTFKAILEKQKDDAILAFRRRQQEQDVIQAKANSDRVIADKATAEKSIKENTTLQEDAIKKLKEVSKVDIVARATGVAPLKTFATPQGASTFRNTSAFREELEAAEKAQKELNLALAAFDIGDKSEANLNKITRGAINFSNALEALDAKLDKIDPSGKLREKFEVLTKSPSTGLPITTITDLAKGLADAGNNAEKAKIGISNAEETLKRIPDRLAAQGRSLDKETEALKTIPSVFENVKTNLLTDSGAIVEALDKTTTSVFNLNEQFDRLRSQSAKIPIPDFSQQLPTTFPPQNTIGVPENFNILPPKITPTTAAPVETNTNTTENKQTSQTFVNQVSPGAVVLNITSEEKVDPQDIYQMIQRFVRQQGIASPFKTGGEA